LEIQNSVFDITTFRFPLQGAEGVVDKLTIPLAALKVLA